MRTKAKSFYSPSPKFQRNKEATRTNPMGPDELAAHEVAQSPNIYRDFQIRHLLKTNISQHLNVQPQDDTHSSQTAGCRGGPHVEIVPLFCVPWVGFFFLPAFLATESTRVLRHRQIHLYFSG